LIRQVVLGSEVIPLIVVLKVVEHVVSTRAEEVIHLALLGRGRLCPLNYRGSPFPDIVPADPSQDQSVKLQEIFELHPVGVLESQVSGDLFRSLQFGEVILCHMLPTLSCSLLAWRIHFSLSP